MVADIEQMLHILGFTKYYRCSYNVGSGKYIKNTYMKLMILLTILLKPFLIKIKNQFLLNFIISYKFTTIYIILLNVITRPEVIMPALF